MGICLESLSESYYKKDNNKEIKFYSTSSLLEATLDFEMGFNEAYLEQLRSELLDEEYGNLNEEEKNKSKKTFWTKIKEFFIMLAENIAKFFKFIWAKIKEMFKNVKIFFRNVKNKLFKNKTNSNIKVEVMDIDSLIQHINTIGSIDKLASEVANNKDNETALKASQEKYDEIKKEIASDSNSKQTTTLSSTNDVKKYVESVEKIVDTSEKKLDDEGKILKKTEIDSKQLAMEIKRIELELGDTKYSGFQQDVVSKLNTKSASESKILIMQFNKNRMALLNKISSEAIKGNQQLTIEAVREVKKALQSGYRNYATGVDKTTDGDGYTKHTEVVASNAKYTSTSSNGAQSVNKQKRKNKKDIPHS